jgi:hypothetical protein
MVKIQYLVLLLPLEAVEVVCKPVTQVFWAALVVEAEAVMVMAFK